MQVNPIIEKGFELAKQARLNAYSPYSNFKVGAAVKAKGIDIIKSGCNVENIAYPSGICAERVAIWSFFPEYSKIDIEWLILVTESEHGDVPCGGCVQVLSEFATDDTEIIIANTEKILKTYQFKDLQPVNFENPVLKR